MSLSAVDTHKEVESLSPSLSNFRNARDLSEALPSIQPGRIIRSAEPAAASCASWKLLHETLGICDLLDLRSPLEQTETTWASPLLASALVCEHMRSAQLKGRVPVPPTPFPAPLIRHQIPLLDSSRYNKALLKQLSWKRLARATGLRLIGNKDSSQAVVMRGINKGGLLMTYKIIATGAGPEVVGVLRLVTASLEQGRGVMLFCKAGKDRTGVMAMLLLHCAGASRDQILDDYHRSDVAGKIELGDLQTTDSLKGLDRSVFDRAPKAAMASFLDYLEKRHGSVAGFLERNGFTAAEQSRLKELLTTSTLKP